MKHHALVIDDDEGIREDVEGRLESLGHTCDSVGCQHTARQKLNSGNKYAYILLDLQIPLRYGKKPLVQNGKNLLNQIRETKGIENMPVIVMTAHGLDGPDLAVEVLRDGQATDFVKKPFPSSGETLEKRIAEALSGRRRPGAAKASSVAQDTDDPQPFEEGTMVFTPSRVELEHVKICGDPESGRIRKILDELRHKDGRGRYVAYSGEELAKRIGCAERGQNGPAEAIRDFRKSVAEEMREVGVLVGPRDIIQSGGRGYRLTDKITVEIKDADDPVNDRVHAQVDPVNDPDDDPLNNRQEWIVEQLQGGAELRIGQVMEQWKCSKTTAKRDLTGLRERNIIEFQGAARTGSWRLKG